MVCWGLFDILYKEHDTVNGQRLRLRVLCKVFGAFWGLWRRFFSSDLQKNRTQRTRHCERTTTSFAGFVAVFGGWGEKDECCQPFQAGTRKEHDTVSGQRLRLRVLREVYWTGTQHWQKDFKQNKQQTQEKKNQSKKQTKKEFFLRGWPPKRGTFPFFFFQKKSVKKEKKKKKRRKKEESETREEKDKCNEDGVRKKKEEKKRKIWWRGGKEKRDINRENSTKKE